MTATIDVQLDHNGESYRIRVRLIPLPLPGGSEMVHFEAVDAGDLDGPLYRLGRKVLLDRLRARAANGDMSPELVQEFEGLVRNRQALPKRGRRIARQVLPSRFTDADATKLSLKLDRKAAHRAAQFKGICTRFRDGEYPELNVMTVGELLLLVLEEHAVELIRETDYVSLLTPDERVERKRARAILRDERAAPEQRAWAEEAYERSERTLDERYEAYYALRRQLMRRAMPPFEVQRLVDNLRKSKRRPELKGMARLLKTDNVDVDCYLPYNAAMVLVCKELRARGYLADLPSQGVCAFMDWPHEYLSGIVPALHPIGALLLQSERFREAVATHATENIDGRGAKSPDTVCDLYGAVLAAVEVYAEEVQELRAKDMMRAGKVVHRHGGESRTEVSFEESRGTADSPRHPVSGAEETRKQAELDLRREALSGPPLVTDEDIAAKFGEDAEDVKTYFRREGRGGRIRTGAEDLAAEYGVHRATIWRRAQRGKMVWERKVAETKLSTTDTDPENDSTGGAASNQ